MGGFSLADGSSVLPVLMVGAERLVSGAGLQAAAAGTGLVLATGGHGGSPFLDFGGWWAGVYG
jgi:hypothetical protein